MGIRNKKVPNSNTKLTRKQIRKEKRKEKKVKRNEFYTNRTKIEKLGSHLNINDCFKVSNKQKSLQNRKQKFGNLNNAVKTSTNKVLSIEEIRNKEQREKNKLQKEMSKQRKKHLLDANIEEDRSIRQLEKQLKLNKRKTKSVPKSFAEDGLDYLLEVCDSETMKTAISTEQELSAVNNEFEEDFALMTGQAKGNKIDKDSYSADDNSVNSSEENEESEYDLDTNSEDCSDEESITSETSREPIISKQKKSKNKFEQNNRDSDENNLQNEKGECLNKQGYEKYKTAKKETPRDKLKTNKNKSNNANDDVIEVVTNSKKRRNGYDDVVINKKTKIISADSCSSNNEDFSTDGVDEGERFSEGEIDEEFGRGAVKKE
ncbi:hypothetical protein NQ315_005983 [Exocentrus adspersus]|uniref:Uncharacterized protein n=1 Tax=Exocentrus adspersus TaxID=1586481 RepID=A0AAV8VC29_9CUCU|nr:hypothetical protein NQ315_005983 [Exocentrus adspersus]